MTGKIKISDTVYVFRSIRSLLSVFCFLFLAFNTRAQSLTANAGADQIICKNDTVKIGASPAASGGTPPYTYSWQPAAGLNSSSSANPNAFPTTQTNYTLTVTDSIGTISTDEISISFLPGPTIDAGPDQTIVQGTATTLQASGGIYYYWYPTSGLTNPETATPAAEPGATTWYCAAGLAPNGCSDFDCMLLTVIPSDTIIIYNAFTPNGDGNNDFLYIGNLQKYPENKIEVFNRNGKIVFQATNYNNDWDGKIDGADLPCATYYVVLNLGSEHRKAQGAVTVIR